MVVRGKQLVDNASQRLFKEGIDHGCLQANHWNKKPHSPIQVCSIDTLYRREIVPEADLIVIDEAHYAVSPSFRWLIDQYKKDVFILGVTATPHVKGGLRHIADDVVYPITLKDLIEQGYLVQPKYLAPSKVDLSKVRTDTKTGDYNMADLAAAYDSEIEIFGDVVKAYRENLKGAPSIVFAINKEHSMHLCGLFKTAGYSAVHIEDSTSMSRRAEVIAGLESGEINVVCNVGIFCVGVDIPCLRGIISVRPTQSYNLWIQQVGRGTRPYPGKEHFIVLDHANNISKHGFIEMERECDLDGKPFVRKDGFDPVICERCYGAFMPTVGEKGKVCPHCGHNNRKEREEAKDKVQDSQNYVMREITAEAALSAHVELLITRVQRNNYKIGWIYYQLEKKYGKAKADELWRSVKKEATRRLGGGYSPRSQSEVRDFLAQ